MFLLGFSPVAQGAGPRSSPNPVPVGGGHGGSGGGIVGLAQRPQWAGYAASQWPEPAWTQGRHCHSPFLVQASPAAGVPVQPRVRGAAGRNLGGALGLGLGNSNHGVSMLAPIPCSSTLAHRALRLLGVGESPIPHCQDGGVALCRQGAAPYTESPASAFPSRLDLVRQCHLLQIPQP